LIKGTFRRLTLKLGRAGIPMVITNHTYAVIGSMFPTKEIGGGCFVPGTMIVTEDGTIAIEEIKEGDKVLTRNGTFEEVLQTHTFHDKETLIIEFEDGHIVECTPEHKFLVGGEWIEASKLQNNDEVDVI